MSEIDFEVDGAVGHIKLNRPEKRNALTMPMFEALAERLAYVAAEDSIRAVLVTGAGQAFCAGHDLNAFAEWPQAADDPVPRFLHALANCRKPMVLAIHGAAAGIGVTWTLHADWVLCSPDASLRLPFVDLGIAPEAGSSVLLARAVGLARARRLLIGGETFTGSEAYEWGLVAELADPALLHEAAWQRACKLAAKHPGTLHQIKDWLHPEGAYANQIDAEVAAINDAVRARCQ